MRRLQVLVIGVCCCSAAAVLAQAGDANKERKQLAGTWGVVSAVHAGEKVDEEKIRQVKVIIAGDKMTFKTPAGDEDTPFTIDPSKKPKHIDLKTKEKGTLKGIYELTGDMLKICASETEERPTTFAAPGGSKAFLVILKRVKE